MATARAAESPVPGRSGSRERTRARLLSVARRAFARKGLAGTNLKDDILGPARVSVGSFYHQFADKTALFLAVLEEHTETFRAMIRAAHERHDIADPVEVARHSYATVFAIAEENHDLFQIMSRERQTEDPRVRAYLRGNEERWIGGLADDYRRLGLAGVGGEEALALAAALVSAMTVGTIVAYLDRSPSERAALRDRLIDGLVRFTMGGLPALVAEAAPSAEPARPTDATRQGKG